MRRLGGLALAAALVGGLLGAAPVQASPDGDEVVISEAYLNGGSSGATFLNKYVELSNPTDEAIDVSGWSVQYRSFSSTSAFTGVIPLGEHQIEPGGTLLVGANSNAANGAALPTPDVTSNIAFSGNTNGGTLALVSSTTALSGDRAAVLGSDQLVDLVGYGASATYEGSAPAPRQYSVTASLNRTDAIDTDDNATDLTGAAPTPQACGEACDGGVVTPPGPAIDATIAEIQGDGAASPLEGTTVTTRGVVTAAYPTGGLDGVYLQTPGTGGDLDLATHDTSDGIFGYSAALADDVRIGDLVEVTGEVTEFFGLTEITPAAGGWTVLDEPVEAVKPATIAFPLTEQERESLEGMVLAPQGGFTLTNNFATSTFAEIGLASGDTGLPQPTDVARPGTPEYDAVVAENARRLVTVDDGATVNYTRGGQDDPVPWLRPDNEVRTGAPVTFTDPVVLDFRNSLWKLQPTQQLLAGGDEPITIGSTRVAAPQDVGGDVSIASFNVLNYFTVTGEIFEANGLGSCTYYTDRTGARVTVNRCNPDGPRGAADAVNLARQQAKIVAAINTLDADVVSLEEIENSAAFGIDRDTALRALVGALNEAAGREQWAAVTSPAALPESEDVIRTAFIHRVGVVEPVGESVINDAPAFDNAREPLSQEFRPTGGDADDDFVVIVNHFKSKGSGSGDDADTGDGQAASNASRVRQATELVAFAERQQTAADTNRLFLTGDFNAYSKEDPIRVLEDAGYVNVPARYTDKVTYQFGGLLGSLDHIFASPAANADVTGADVWDINADESIGREYSRYRNNVTDLYDASPFRASDHDPAIVGFNAVVADPEPEIGPTRITVTGTTGPPRTTISVSVVGGEVPADGGRLLVLDRRRTVGVATVRDGQATVRLTGVGRGKRSLSLVYEGDDTLGPADASYAWKG
ncbi:ExeM/NucH family extracellular endonuclease [Aeromicrobium sp. CF3.5]|uniref:ExeM/NucH family extracellular endonuclease n=1 Tax=Aeromicrobium sp. CF3.5 TaxID=3373078 RepID=UPI003EE53A19